MIHVPYQLHLSFLSFFLPQKVSFIWLARKVRNEGSFIPIITIYGFIPSFPAKGQPVISNKNRQHLHWTCRCFFGSFETGGLPLSGTEAGNWRLPPYPTFDGKVGEKCKINRSQVDTQDGIFWICIGERSFGMGSLEWFSSSNEFLVDFLSPQATVTRLGNRGRLRGWLHLPFWFSMTFRCRFSKVRQFVFQNWFWKRKCLVFDEFRNKKSCLGCGAASAWNNHNMFSDELWSNELHQPRSWRDMKTIWNASNH